MRRLPDHIRFLARHCAIGFAIAAAAVAVLLAFDVANLRSLAMVTEGGWLAMAVLTFFMGLTCASAQMGIAIMSLAEPPESRGGPPAGPLAMLPAVVPRAAAGRR